VDCRNTRARPVHPLETYLHELHDIRSTGGGVAETSYYTPLANLLNAVGNSLKPRVRCVINLQNIGGGVPDGGLFTPDQIQRGVDEPLQGQKPSRGAIECKSTKDDALLVTDTERVSKYWQNDQSASRPSMTELQQSSERLEREVIQYASDKGALRHAAPAEKRRMPTWDSARTLDPRDTLLYSIL
jgi:hypothetical protein